MLTFILIGAVIATAAAWWTAGLMERLRHQSRARDLESKLRYAYGETESLRSRIAGLQAESQALKESLCAERESQRTVLSGLALSFRKTMLAMGAGCLITGIAAGGGAGWWTASAQAVAGRAELELTARVTAFKAEVMEKRVEKLESELAEARKTLLDERVEKEVARTKLRILLDSLTPGKWLESFFVDQNKLKKNLENQMERNSPPSDLPVFKSPLMQR